MYNVHTTIFNDFLLVQLLKYYLFSVTLVIYSWLGILTGYYFIFSFSVYD